MAIEKQVGRFTIPLVDDVADWKKWLSLRWTICAGFFSAMTAATAAHAPWWFVAGCSGAAFLCNSASGTTRVIAQKPKDGAASQCDPPPEET